MFSSCLSLIKKASSTKWHEKCEYQIVLSLKRSIRRYGAKKKGQKKEEEEEEEEEEKCSLSGAPLGQEGVQLGISTNWAEVLKYGAHAPALACE